MARSPRTAVAPPPPANSTPSASAISTRPSRRRQSVSTSTAPSTPFTPGPVTPSDSSTPFSGFTASAAGPSRAQGGTRGHSLRIVGTAADRTPCPFPSEYGGREKCGVVEEDELDEVLMATCGALAMLNNKALSPEEIARISVDNGWIRPPTAAVEPTAPFNASIRNHFKRCEKSVPPRQPLISKYQLGGSAAEQILQPALHPNAFDGGARPKGVVYYLSPSGKLKWKNPFQGMEVPKHPAKKPGPVKKYPKEKEKRAAKDKDAGLKGKAKNPVLQSGSGAGPSVPPVKLRLFLNPAGAAAKEKERERELQEKEQSRARSGEMEDMDMGISPSDSAGPSVPASRESSGRTSPLVPPSTSFPPRRNVRRPSRPYDSTDDSDTSDSEDEAAAGSNLPNNRFPRLNRPLRRSAPAPIAISGSPRFPHLSRLPQGSPFKELFFPSSTHAASFPFCPPSPHPAPFPTHSLDNTLWTVRAGEPDRYGFESSSSSSDDEMRDPDWGQTSGILIRADDEEVPVWAAGTEDEAKIKEATDALRVLFPMVNTDERMEVADPLLEFNQLDNNRPFPSDTSSIAESTSTAAPARPFRSLDGLGLAHIPLNTWIPNSSPVPSPVMRVSVPLPVDTSPTQHLSRLSTSLEEGMDIDEDQSWLDEAGEGPVRADPDDALSDSEVISQPGDVASPEHDRRRHTAEWAREAAVSTAFRVKEELVDYPSPGLTECDEDPDSLSPHDISRASSAETQPHSSAGSDVLLDEVEEYEDTCGPESMTVEDVDGMYHPLCPVERTPQRGKKGRGRAQPSGPQHRRTSSSGKIGVAALQCTPRNSSPAAKVVTRNLRPSTRRRKSSTAPIALDHPPTPPLTEEPLELDDSPPPQTTAAFEWGEAIGTAELERAMADAEAKEEEHRLACKERAEQKRALLEAYRQRIGSSPDNRGINWDNHPHSHTPHSASFSDLASASGAASAAATPSAAPWGSASTDSLYMANAGSGAMSPMALHSMSMLSLRDMPSSVDPRALRSPPMILGAGMGMDEMAGMQGVMGIQPGNGGAGGDVVMDGSTADVGIPIPKPNQPQQRPQPPPHTAATSTTATTANTTAAQTRPAPASTATTSAPAPGANAPVSRVSTPTPAGTTAPARPAPRADNQGHHIAVPLCNGVRISVISMIPVYFLNHTSKLGTFVVIRRIDSDFVNATSLLLALGIPKNKHHTIVNPTGNNPFPCCKEVHEPLDPETGYDPGVVGLWIRLHDARFLRDRFKGQGHAENPIWALLNDDIVEKFVAIIKNQDISHIHTNKEHFGSTFHTTSRNTNTTAPPSSSTSTPTSTGSSAPGAGAGANRPRAAPVAIAARKPGQNPTPTAGAGPVHLRANSASTATAPPRPMTAASTPLPTPLAQSQGAAQSKGALIRPAIANPDECPQAKRRRATVVGTTAPKPLLVAKQNTAAPVPIASKVAPAPGSISKPPPSMVQPVRPAAPTVTVTPVSANQVQAQVAPMPVKRAGMAPVSAPVGGASGNKAAVGMVAGGAGMAGRISAPPSAAAAQANTSPVNSRTIVAQPQVVTVPSASNALPPSSVNGAPRRMTRASGPAETVKG